MDTLDLDEVDKQDFADADLQNYTDAAQIKTNLSFWQKVISKKEELQKEVRSMLGNTPLDDFFSRMKTINEQSCYRKQKLHILVMTNRRLDDLIRSATENPKFAKPSNFTIPEFAAIYDEKYKSNKDEYQQLHAVEVDALKEDVDLLMLSFIKE